MTMGDVEREPWPRWLVVLLTAALCMLAFGVLAVLLYVAGPSGWGGIAPVPTPK